MSKDLQEQKYFFKTKLQKGEQPMRTAKGEQPMKTAKGEQPMNTTKQANQHDRFFKRFYSEPQFAIDIFKLALSKEEFSACNWNTLKAEKDSLKDKRADLVFTVSLKNKKKS